MKDYLTEYIKPFRIFLKNADGDVEEASSPNTPLIISKGTSIVIDFGRELQGGIMLVAGSSIAEPATARLVFGESFTESLSQIGYKNATNNHAVRDFEVNIPASSRQEFGTTGFRFVQIEALSDNLELAEVKAVFRHYKMPEGSFTCSDSLLNDIFSTAAYTAHLCIQEGEVWDGIKRDRWVWAGDLHAELAAYNYLYGDLPFIRSSLEYLITSFNSKTWINSIPTYSMWWLACLCDYYFKTGDREYAVSRIDNAKEIISDINNCVNTDGSIDFSSKEFYEEMDFFLDWQTLRTPDAVPGTYAMLLWGCKKASAFFENLGIRCDECKQLILKLCKSPVLLSGEAKQVAAFRVLGGFGDINKDTKIILNNSSQNISTFMSGYILSALGRGDKAEQAMQICREYFGGMLSRGATTFWEDFDVNWLDGSGRIDSIPLEGQRDIHGDYGKYCYTGFRHSLCHGWSAGAVPFLMNTVLGINVAKHGCAEVVLTPRLCGLTYAEGVFPLPQGKLEIRHSVNKRGITETEYSAPPGVKVTLK